MEQRKIPDHIETPSNIRLGISQVDKRRLGSFSTCAIPKGTEFGPYKGKIVYDKESETVDPKFSWKVFDLTTFKYLHTVDATCPADGNWMRYVCCARYFEEQNIVSTQNGTDVYYRALKDIDSGEELLTWFEQKKKKRKKSSVKNNESEEMHRVSSSSSLQTYSDTPPQSPGKMKRKRKPKIIPDAYEGPIDWEDQDQKSKKPLVKEDEFEPLQPGQKRRRRKKPSIDSLSNVDANNGQKPTKSSAENIDKKSSITNETDGVFEEIEDKDGDIDGNLDESDSKNASFNSETSSIANSVEGKKESSHLSIAEINNSVEWEFPKAGEEYNFELKKHHVVKDNGKKIYRCDICLGLYKHMFSLKRHYLRNHINYKYISKADMTNCLINLMQAKQQMKTKLAALADLRTFKTKPDLNKLKNHSSEISIDNQVMGNPPCVNDSEVMDVNEANVNDTKPELKELKKETHGEVSKEKEDLHLDSKLGEKDTNISNIDDASIDNEKTDNQVEKSDDNLKPENVESEVPLQTEDNINDSLSSEDKLKQKNESANLQQIETNVNDNLQADDKLKQDGDCKGANIETENENKSEDTDKTDVTKLKPGLFRCYTCYLTFDDFEGIREHTQNHPEQMEGECFPCDLCSMRFNYKHNLIRHKKTHFNEGSIKSTSSAMATNVTSAITGQGQDKPSPRKPVVTNKVKSSPEKKPGLLPSVFRCGVCPMKFDTQQLVVKHVEEEHKNGSKFQCIYCGKCFLSMPNMKKHVRFHLGYRATCKICSEAFSNVGALRKHTRVVHPEDYRAKLIERLQKYGVLKGPDKNALSKEVIEKISSDHKASKVSEQPKEIIEPVKKEKVKSESSSPVHKKEEEIDHEINFTADEIDDGGSRFKFACTVCKKRFSSYINMCRHRRKVHSNENRHRTIECLTFGRKPRVNPSPILENPLDVAAFFANISHNIATNLNCYIDGKSESLKGFASHIKVEDYKGSFGYSAESEADVKISLNQYNFPQGFKLAETISFADIKNILNIHNDFDSHCTSAAEIQESVQEQTESAEDCEVRKINSVKDVDNTFDTMKNSSQGFKVLANVGSMLSKRGSAPLLLGDKEMDTDKKLLINQRVGGCHSYNNSNSPAARTFHQIERGEYANFQDDITGDMDNPIAVRSQSVSSSRSLYSKRSYRQKETDSSEDEDRLSPNSLTKILVKDAQGEIDSLYDDIDNMKPVQNVCNNNNKTPKSLSSLCENVLGLCSPSKVKKARSLTNEVANHLKLSTKEDKKNGPDFSDVPEDSPFYNYDTIMFGRNGQIEQICAICRRHYSDVDHLIRHHMKKHPASVCSFLEVENGNDIEDLHFSQPCPIGALAVTDPGLESVSELPGFRCTNCDSTFPSMSKLHVHIVNCSSIDPLYGVQKGEKSPVKTTFRKKFQKKIFNMFGSSKNYRYNFSGKYNHLSTSSLNHKRVFMGCRKRKAVILPDSPVKTYVDQKQLLQSGSGYNPQNHARRREFTDVLNNLMCEACGLQFKTIILLERHVKHCDKKEKFKTLQPMTSSLDNYFEKKKNMCLYCHKNFTYTKSLLNHFQDFCPVKKTKLDNGELTELEKQKEAEIIERIHKADEEKALKQKEMEARPKRKISWQVGRKSKRKGHSWTNIKKRNQLKGSKGSSEGSEEINGEGGDEDEDDDDNDDIDETSSDDDDDNDGDGSDNEGSSHDSNSGSYHNENNEDVFQPDGQEVPNEIEEVENGDNGLDKALKSSIKDKKDGDILSAMEVVNDEGEKKMSNDSPVKLNDKLPVNKMIESESKVSLNDEMHDSEPKQTTEAEQEKEDSFRVTDDFSNCEDLTDRLLSENEQTLKRYSIGNTSLNCTARYKVNDVQLPKKYRPIRPKPTLIKCISEKLCNNGDPSLSGLEPNPSALNMNHSYLYKPTKVKHQNKTSEVKQCVTQSCDKQTTSTDAPEVTGKRRRKQVGKVEEFLKAFRKKNKKKSENNEQSTENCSEVKCNSLNENETSSEVNKEHEIKHDVAKNENELKAGELDMPNITSNDLNNSGFVSFDLPPGSTPPSIPRKRGRPRKEEKGNCPNKKLGRPPKLFPSVKSSVPNLLKRRVGRPPKLKRENIEMINYSELNAAIPDVMTNPALTFTHLVKNNDMKYLKDKNNLGKMPEESDGYQNEGFQDLANNVVEDPFDNVLITNHAVSSSNEEVVHKSNDDDDDDDNDNDNDIDEVDNYSDPATEPFSDSCDDIEELYREALNKEQMKGKNNEELLQDGDNVECPDHEQNIVQPETTNSEIEKIVGTELGDISNVTKEKFDEIDGSVKNNEASDETTSESAVTADTKDEIQDVDSNYQGDIVDEIVNAESETNPESDYKTESECENVAEEELDDRKENGEVDIPQETMTIDSKDDGSDLKDAEKDGDLLTEDKSENFDEFLKFEPFLSPSERVKMNKRSCKKDVELTSPEWMKRTKKYIGKNEKKSDSSSKSCDSSSDVEEPVKPNVENSVGISKDKFDDRTDNSKNLSLPIKDNQSSKGKKRKIVDSLEKDCNDSSLSKIPRREVKVCSKKNMSAKGKK